MSFIADRRIGLRSLAIPALAALATLAACQRAEEARPPEVRPVRTMTVAKALAGDVVTLNGTVQAQTEINQAFRISGRLVERSVSIGDSIQPGQPIARLDSQNEETSLLAARAQLDAARARQSEAQSMYTRMRDLVAQRAVSQAQFESAEAAARSASSAVESAASQVTLAQTRVGDTRLVADVAGVVTAQGAEPGEVVGAGQMVIQVARDGGRDAVFDVPARAKAATSLNTPITVTLTADPKVSANAVVREISPRADPLTGTFRVRARLANPPVDMRLGSTITGRLKLAATEVIEIPPSAVVRTDRQAAVWVVDTKTGTVASRPIEIRSSDPNRVEVASGLNPGDVVVTAGAQALRPGQKVSLLKAQP
jgi:RND family efflux transporter MFP subunit